MGLVGYCGRGLGNTVDIAFRNVIRFYRLDYIPPAESRRLLIKMDANAAVRIEHGRKLSRELKCDQIRKNITMTIFEPVIV